MANSTSGPLPRRKVTPSQLPLREQAALVERLQRARGLRPPKSWQQLAVEEGFAQRTLEYFRGSADKVEENTDQRPDAEIAEERARRFIHARATAMPASRRWSWGAREATEGQDGAVGGKWAQTRVDVPEDFIPSPARREITPSQLPLRDQAALFARLHEARGNSPAHSWRYLEVAEGFAQRTLEHFYRSAMKLEKNAYKRPLAQIFGELLRARSSAMPVGRRSSWGPGEVGGEETSAVERRRNTEAGRRARKTKSAAETYRSEALLRDERRAAEARDVERQQRRAQDHLARAEEMVREAAQESHCEAEEEQLREGDPLRQLMEVWDSSWGPRPVESPFDV